MADTGPLVALLNRREGYHDWASAQWTQISPPLMTCEAVLTEAHYLLRDIPPCKEALIEMVRRGHLALPFHLAENAEAIALLLRKYADVPMSLADACLVRMAELYPDSHVLTLDRDFRIYRKDRSRVVPTIMPEDI